MTAPVDVAQVRARCDVCGFRSDHVAHQPKNPFGHAFTLPADTPRPRWDNATLTELARRIDNRHDNPQTIRQHIEQMKAENDE